MSMCIVYPCNDMQRAGRIMIVMWKCLVNSGGGHSCATNCVGLDKCGGRLTMARTLYPPARAVSGAGGYKRGARAR